MSMEAGVMFTTTRDQFLATLKNIYPEVAQKLPVLPSTAADTLQWAQEVTGPLRTQIANKDPSVFRARVPSLDVFCIGELWARDDLSDQSRAYIWQYLERLDAYSRAASQRTIQPPPPAPPPPPTLRRQTTNKTKQEKKKEKTPLPPLPEGLPFGTGLRDVIAEMTAEMGENPDPTKLDFEAISERVFDSIRPEDMKQMAKFTGQSMRMMAEHLQQASSGTETGEGDDDSGGDLAAMLGKMMMSVAKGATNGSEGEEPIADVLQTVASTLASK